MVRFRCMLMLIASLSSIKHIFGVSLSPSDFMICGGIATALTDAILYPIDTVKVIQQSSRVPVKALQAFNQVVKASGPSGLYRGVEGYASIDGFGASIFFTVYERIKHEINARISSPLNPYISASLAFITSSTFMVPAELIKVKMQSGLFPSLSACIRHLWTHENAGIFGLYNGYQATLLRDIPYFALQLGCYGIILLQN